MDKNNNKLQTLIDLAMQTPIQYGIATASKLFPDANADEILFKIHNNQNPIEFAEGMYNVPILYNQRKYPIGFNKEDIISKHENLLMLCPFHPDRKLGSFVITPQKGLWYCFTDSIGGSILDFEQEYFDLNFKEAVYHFSYRMGYISKDDYKKREYKKIDVVPNVVKNNKSTNRIDECVSPKANPNIIHNVYTAMPLVFPLSEKHKKHLLNKRRISKSSLKDYFTFSKRENIERDLMNMIVCEYSLKHFGKRPEDLTDSELEKVRQSKSLRELRESIPFVPGFFFDKKKNELNFSCRDGIGIILRDDSGRAIGIQNQKTNKYEIGAKYIWFSSAFASNNKMYTGGSSPGSPSGVIFPTDTHIKEPSICITEGRYKAEMISKQGNIAIYVSGVSAWKTVIPIIERLKESRKKIYIMFDSDLMGNVSVHTSLKDMSSKINAVGLTPILILWRKEYGKGFDDLVINQGILYYKKYLKTISFEEFEKKYQEALSIILLKYKVKRPKDINQSNVATFSKELQSCIENVLTVPKI